MCECISSNRRTNHFGPGFCPTSSRFQTHRHRGLSTDQFNRLRCTWSKARPVAARGLFGGLFSGSKADKSGKARDKQAKDIDLSKLDLGKSPERVVLSQVDGEDGPAEIVYRAGRQVNIQEVEDLCQRVGWPKRQPEKLKGALENSFLEGEDLCARVGRLKRQPEKLNSSLANSCPVRLYQVCTLTLEKKAADNSSSDPRLIGLARAISDHAFNATIWDVLVDPDFQGQGLGKALVEQMVQHMLREGISNITLFANAEVVDFYKRMGFEADPEGIKGMFWYPRF